jgi:hypothetical protein
MLVVVLMKPAVDPFDVISAKQPSVCDRNWQRNKICQ